MKNILKNPFILYLLSFIILFAALTVFQALNYTDYTRLLQGKVHWMIGVMIILTPFFYAVFLTIPSIFILVTKTLKLQKKKQSLKEVGISIFILCVFTVILQIIGYSKIYAVFGCPGETCGILICVSSFLVVLLSLLPIIIFEIKNKTHLVSSAIILIIGLIFLTLFSSSFFEAGNVTWMNLIWDILVIILMKSALLFVDNLKFQKEITSINMMQLMKKALLYAGSAGIILLIPGILLFSLCSGWGCLLPLILMKYSFIIGIIGLQIIAYITYKSKNNFEKTFFMVLTLLFFSIFFLVLLIVLLSLFHIF